MDLTLLEKLIRKPSITPNDAGCIDILADYFNQSPIIVERNQTKNAYFEFGSGPLFLFVGHTDVVSPGPLENWQSPPFSLTQKDHLLFGRGLVDMKGSIYAFSHAYQNISHKLKGRVGILLTSDEEGDGKDGLSHALDKLNLRAKWALVGEPTSMNKLGDTYKHQRRGSNHFHLKLRGKQGHIAYPHHAKNPCDLLQRFLNELSVVKKNLPFGNDLSVFSIESASHVSNIIPSFISIQLNLRYTDLEVVKTCLDFLKGFDDQLIHILGAKPYQSHPTLLKDALTQAIWEVTQLRPKSSMLGGVSDARLLQDIATEIIEFGLCSHSAHQANEHTTLQDLEHLSLIYEKILLTLMGGDNPTKNLYTTEKSNQTC